MTEVLLDVEFETSADATGGGTRLSVPEAGLRHTPSASADDLATVCRERDEYREALQRTTADFANYRKRVRREQQDASARAVAKVIDRMLPLLDALDRARSNHPEAAEPIDAALHSAFLALGVDRLDPVGERFDAGAHDAVAANDDEAADDHADLVVVEVLRPGYRCRGRLVRPAMVRVGRAQG